MKTNEQKSKLWLSLKIIASIWILSYIVAMFFSVNTVDFGSGNVAVIPINSMILTSGESFGSSVVSSDTIIGFLEKAESNPNIKVIVIDINSPGGSGVAADEIGQKIKSMEKPVISVIRELGASAAYWIASSTDYIFANRMSLTASIGVTGSYLDFSQLMKEYNVSYQRYVSGDLKDMASPFKEPSNEERKLFQDIIDESHMFFVEEVSINRNMSINDINKIADGRIILGKKAYELGLIDELGTKQDVFNYIETKYNISVVPVEYKEKVSFSDLVYGLSFQGNGKFIKSDNSILLS